MTTIFAVQTLHAFVTRTWSVNVQSRIFDTRRTYVHYMRYSNSETFVTFSDVCSDSKYHRVLHECACYADCRLFTSSKQVTV